MADKRPINERDPLPESFDSPEALGEFWDTHDSADYEDLMGDEEILVMIESGDSVYYCAIAKDLMAQLRETARKQGVSTQTLVNLWLQEKLTAQAT